MSHFQRLGRLVLKSPLSLLISILVLTFSVQTTATDLEFGPPLTIRGNLIIPTAVTVDEDRNRVFVADAGDHQIKYIDLPLTSSTPTWQSFGFITDRSAANALSAPQGLTVDSNGHIYVVDTFHNQVKLYRYDSSSDAYTFDERFARNTRTNVAGIDIQSPRDIARGPGDQIYLLDSANHRVLVAHGPDARSWTVWHSNTNWNNPYGLDVGTDGSVYIADTDNHQIIKIDSSRTETVAGQYGTATVEFRYPRDLAIGPANRYFIADTNNHRIQILQNDQSYYRQLGAGRLFDGIDNIVVTSENALFAVDRIDKKVIAYQGPIDPQPYDAYIRDAITDDGSQPSSTSVQFTSPDIKYRYSNDIDLSRAEDFDRYGNDVPIFGENIYIYARAFNKGLFDFPSSFIKFYSLNTDPPYDFPEHWLTDSLFLVNSLGELARAGNQSVLSSIPGIDPSVTPPLESSVIVGPILWQVPPSTIEHCDSQARIAARIININDPTQTADGLEILPLNNNVAALETAVVSASCIPDPDRYEENDRPASTALVTETWEHLHRRCPRVITRAARGLPYPERICTGVFQNYLRPGDSRSAEEIWTLVVPNLSLHSREDRDFFDIPLPNPGSEEYNNDDIRSAEDIIRFPTEKVPMPECGTVQRTEFGPTGLDNTIYLTIGTQLTVSIEPTDASNNSLTTRTLNPIGEQLHLYQDESRTDELWAGSPIQKTIDCPQKLHEMSTIRISFGELERERLRELTSTGGYQIRLEYITTIERGTPSWVGELGPGRPGRGFGCRPLGRGFPGRSTGGFASGMSIPLPNMGVNFFPNCIPGLNDFFIGDFFHPSSPLIPDCIADGPGCFDLSLIRFIRPEQDFEVFFRSNTPMAFSILGENTEIIAASQAIASPDQIDPNHIHGTIDPNNNQPGSQFTYLHRLFIPKIDAGVYVFSIKGKPSRFSMEFRPPTIEALDQVID